MTTDLAAAARSDWRTTAAEAANQRWYVHRAKNPPPPDYPRDMELENKECYGAGFADGARWSFVESSKLAPAMASLADFVDWLRSAGTSPQVDLEEVRAAWRAVKHVIYSGVSSDLVDEFDAMDILLGLHSEA